jgi:hypothetical protein
LTAGIENEVFKNHKKDITEEERALIEELAGYSYGKYSALKQHPLLFLIYKKLVHFSITVKPILEVALASVVQVTN